MTHISHFSGGIGSWAATKRVAKQFGVDDLHLIFADTLIEDDDLYRFVLESLADIYGKRLPAVALAIPDVVDDLPGRKAYLSDLRERANAAYPNLHWIAEGRTPWEVFRDERFVGNSRIDPCSKILKRQFIDDYCSRRFAGVECVHYFGIDWTEEHRIVRVQERMVGKTCVAPLCSAPLLTKAEFIAQAELAGIKPPRLYGLGFSHNNCGSFCVKSGQAQFQLLLKTNPRLYAYHERQEALMMEYLERADCTILRCRRNLKPGEKAKPLSLKAFRLRLEASGEFDKYEWGGCGCAL